MTSRCRKHTHHTCTFCEGVVEPRVIAGADEILWVSPDHEPVKATRDGRPLARPGDGFCGGSGQPVREHRPTVIR